MRRHIGGTCLFTLCFLQPTQRKGQIDQFTPLPAEYCTLQLKVAKQRGTHYLVSLVEQRSTRYVVSLVIYLSTYVMYYVRMSLVMYIFMYVMYEDTPGGANVPTCVALATHVGTLLVEQC